MKIKILEYKFWQGNRLRVRSHNCRKGIWKENPQWGWHKYVVDMNAGNILDLKEYTKEVQDGQ